MRKGKFTYEGEFVENHIDGFVTYVKDTNNFYMGE
jgi:hypothetical protein